MMLRTGPKISSWAIVILLSTSANTEGCTKEAVVRALGPAAAADQPRALLDALGDVALDPGPLLLRDQRPDLGGRVRRRPHRQRLHESAYGVDDFVVARAWRQDAGLADAGLAGVHDPGEHHHRDRGGEVDVLEDDRRRLPAQ